MTAPAAQFKNLYIGNAYLVRQQLRIYDQPSDTFLPWTTGPASVSLCTQSVNATTGVVTYTPIPGLGPYTMTQGGVPGTWSVEIPTSAIATLNVALYLNGLVYQVVTGGPANELADVQPLLVLPSRYPT
jgi:hypothetical protein